MNSRRSRIVANEGVLARRAWSVFAPLWLCATIFACLVCELCRYVPARLCVSFVNFAGVADSLSALDSHSEKPQLRVSFVNFAASRDPAAADDSNGLENGLGRR